MVKLLNLRNSNKRYWDILVERSKYTEAEIISTLEDVEAINERYAKVMKYAFETLLTDADGPMGAFEGYASDAHKALHAYISDTCEIHPSMSQNSHLNCFPVATWAKEVKQLKKRLDKIENWQL